MSRCTQDCNQGRNCTCRGIEMDYGKADRYIFLNSEREHHKMNTFIKFLLFIAAIYFLGHIAYALADTGSGYPPVIRCVPTGTGSITCYPM